MKKTPWIFGYGSLMWNPGFDYVEKRPALLYGYHRSFCVYSHVYRGTPEKPGLVLGLGRGGSCRGMAFRIKEKDWPKVRKYLQDREQVTSVYVEIFPTIQVDGRKDSASERVAGYCFIADHTHHQYAGSLPLHEQARIVNQGHGKGGPNKDYLHSTVDHLHEMGITDGPLHRLSRLVER